MFVWIKTIAWIMTLVPVQHTVQYPLSLLLCPTSENNRKNRQNDQANKQAKLITMHSKDFKPKSMQAKSQFSVGYYLTNIQDKMNEWFSNGIILKIK